VANAAGNREFNAVDDRSQEVPGYDTRFGNTCDTGRINGAQFLDGRARDISDAKGNHDRAEGVIGVF
jgi:hypothetical protein